MPRFRFPDQRFINVRACGLAVLMTAFPPMLTPPRSLLASNAAPAASGIERSVLDHYAAIAQAGYDDALTGARALSTAVNAFLERPAADTLDRARQAWIEARVPYVQTEAYRFYDGPIDAVEGLINSWPIDENLIDYADDEAEAGIVNQPEAFPALTSDLIVSLNEKDGEKNITAGFHAIEFLLWGQDRSDDGPGARSHLDYVDGQAPNAARRREYLRLATGLLIQHLETVAAEWAPDSATNYRARFLAMPREVALAAVLKGIGILSGAELAGERLTVPYETKEQEDEHSCFSDTTDRDILSDTLGIRRVVTGRYERSSGERIEGPAVADLLAAVDPALAVKLRQQVDESVAAARAVPAPFDRAIQGNDHAPGRIAIKRLITALRAQADSIAEAGAALGLTLNF